MRPTPTPPTQYLVGFASAIVMIAALALLLQTYKWFTTNHGSYIEFVTTPMFSIANLFSMVLVLLLLGLVVLAARYMPR